LAWANIKHLLITFLLWFFILFWVYYAWKYDKTAWEERPKLAYITERLDIFLQDNKKLFEKSKIKKDKNYQIKQALITVWSWWFSWVGFWKSIQKYWYLPEVQWDFIFSIIVNELWFIWALVLLNIFLYIWYRWFLIWFLSKDLFAKFIAYWITSWILLQAFINIWVNLNILPLTWITLPFVSYWGSSLLVLSIGIWILLNISRNVDFNQSIFNFSFRKRVSKRWVRIRNL
jgi:cell division protein FtsW (lipid II flippase)